MLVEDLTQIKIASKRQERYSKAKVLPQKEIVTARILFALMVKAFARKKMCCC